MPERPRSSNSSLGLCCKRGRPRITLPFPLRGGGVPKKIQTRVDTEYRLAPLSAGNGVENLTNASRIRFSKLLELTNFKYLRVYVDLALELAEG